MKKSKAVNIVTVPEDEAWLWENPVALALVLKGIEETNQGKGEPNLLKTAMVKGWSALGGYEEFEEIAYGDQWTAREVEIYE